LASNAAQSDASMGAALSMVPLSKSASALASAPLLASAPPSDRTVQSQSHAARAIAKTPKNKPKWSSNGRDVDVRTLGVPAGDATLRAMRVQRWRAGLAVVSASLITFSAQLARADARADDAATDARAAYNEGLVAHQNGDEKSAARDFARADALVPSNEALEAAAASALLANDAILGMTLVERAQSRTLDARATDTIAHARSTFASRVTTVLVDCAGHTECTAVVDDASLFDAHAPFFVIAGQHAIVISLDKTSQITRDVACVGGDVLRIGEEAPRASHGPAGTTGSGLRPYAYAAIGVTLVLGGIAIASGIDAKSKRSDFERGDCGNDSPTGTSPSSDCAQLASSGHSAQLRTNWIFAGTAVAAAATLAFVIIAKPFGSRSNVAVTASLGGVSGALTF
jgi:hypothetical protein